MLLLTVLKSFRYGSFYCSTLNWCVLESCAGRVNPCRLWVPAFAGASVGTCRAMCVSAGWTWCNVGMGWEILCVANWMLIQCILKWHDQEIQCWRELTILGCSNIFQWWWWDHRLKCADLSDLARNMLATTSASEQVFSKAGNVVNRTNLKSSSTNKQAFSSVL